MELDLKMHEQLILYQLISDTHDNIIIKTNRDGYVVFATPLDNSLGLAVNNALIGPHIIDLACEESKASLTQAFDNAVNGLRAKEWIEFASPLAPNQQFAIRLGTLRDEMGTITGALGIVRSRGEVKHLEDQLFRAELTDPLTGLTNRQAWMEMLKHLMNTGDAACLALIDIDHFKAINLHYGVSAGDKILIAFADFLRGQAPIGVSISRVAGSRFAMLFPGYLLNQADKTCREIVEAFAKLRCTDWQNRFSVTASIGVTAISLDVDETIKAAESALHLARAIGGNTVTTDQKASAYKARSH